jgi:hypothetical protein
VRNWNRIVVLTSVVVLAIVGCLAGYYEFDLRPYAPWFTPVVAWFTVSKGMRKYFRLAWFWWTSSLFVIGSGSIVATSILARANGFLWMVILVVEAAVFAGLVEFINSQLFGSLQDG